MKIEKTKKPDFISTITITLHPSDYLHRFESDLKKLKSRMNMKGFRKGKTPESLIKKMYGSSVFSDTINQILNDYFTDYLKENNIKKVAQPIISEGQDPIIVDHTDYNKEYQMSFDINELEPINIVGNTNADSYNYYTAIATDVEVDEDLTNLSLQFGNLEEVDDIQENDHFDATIVELENGQAKENGIYTENIKIFINVISDQDLKEQIVKLKKGESFVTKLTKIENKEEAFLKKYLLHLPETDERPIDGDFQVTINTINRHVPAIVNDEFIKEKLPELKAETLEEGKIAMKKNIEAFYENNSKQLLYQDIKRNIMDNTFVSISESFIKRWLKNSEKLSEEKIEEELKAFMLEMKWTIIRNELVEKYDIKINEGEIKRYAYSKAYEYLSQYRMENNQELIVKIAQNILDDDTQHYQANNAIITSKIFTNLESEIQKINQTVTIKELVEMTDKLKEIN